MRELSLFSGAGGGLLASKYFLGWKTVGYVEIEDYCQKVIAQRIKDGLLEEAPIFGDIRKFIDQGYAESYKGLVDVVTGGFPCQPFSVAGKRAGENDERNMWPSTRNVIEIVKPSYAFLENVPGLISCGYLGVILQDLEKIGYDAKWRCLSAVEVGAPHKRERLWIVANSNTRSGISRIEQTRREKRPKSNFCRERTTLGNSNGIRRRLQQELSKRKKKAHSIDNGKKKFMANTYGILSRYGNVRNVKIFGNGKKKRQPKISIQCGQWWEFEPNVGRVVNEFSNRMDQIRKVKK